MFDSVCLRNFRSIADSGPIELSNLNILLGPNSSGKSSILYGLLMLRQTLADKDFRQALITSGPFVDLGGFMDLKKSRASVPHVAIGFKVNPSLVLRFPKGLISTRGIPLSTASDFEFSFGWDPKTKSVAVVGFTIRGDKGNTLLAGVRHSDKWSYTGMPKGFLRHTKLLFRHFVPQVLIGGKKPKSDSLASAITGTMTQAVLLGQFISSWFEEVRYVAPIRERIPWYGFPGVMGPTEISPSGQNLIRALSARSPREREHLLRDLRNLLDKKLGVVHKLELLPIDKHGLVVTLTGYVPGSARRVNLAAMGCGVSELFPVAVQTLLTGKEGCLLVEQPEIHLHPGAQADLADLFATRAQEGIGQYIIETHSEHFLSRIRRRVADGTLKPKRVRVLFFELHKGVTRIKQASINGNGSVSNWPRGFFSQGYDEALAIATEAAKRGA